jgi:hypothetical protein
MLYKKSIKNKYLKVIKMFFGQLMLLEWIEYFIVSFIILFVLIVIWFYKRSSLDKALIRTGFGSVKVCTEGGMIVFPLLHKLYQISLKPFPLSLEITPEQNIRTIDQQRVVLALNMFLKISNIKNNLKKIAPYIQDSPDEWDYLKKMISYKLEESLKYCIAIKRSEDLLTQQNILLADIKNLFAKKIFDLGISIEEISFLSFKILPEKSFWDEPIALIQSKLDSFMEECKKNYFFLHDRIDKQGKHHDERFYTLKAECKETMQQQCYHSEQQIKSLQIEYKKIIEQQSLDIEKQIKTLRQECQEMISKQIKDTEEQLQFFTLESQTHIEQQCQQIQEENKILYKQNANFIEEHYKTIQQKYQALQEEWNIANQQSTLLQKQLLTQQQEFSIAYQNKIEEHIKNMQGNLESYKTHLHNHVKQLNEIQIEKIAGIVKDIQNQNQELVQEVTAQMQSRNKATYPVPEIHLNDILKFTGFQKNP